MVFACIGASLACPVRPGRSEVMRSMNTLDTTYTSPLVLADKLIGLAELADHSGHRQCAVQLLEAAFAVLDDHVFVHATSAGRNAQVANRFQASGTLN